MSLSQQLKRIYWIDAEIRAGRYPNPEKVAAKFEVATRTAKEDMRRLRDDLEAPVKAKRGYGWYYTDPSFMLPFLALSESEARSLNLSLRVAEEYMSAAEAQMVGLLLERLASQLGPADATVSLSGAIHLDPMVPVNAELLRDCQRAVRERQRLWLRYWGAHKDQETERVVHPYRVHFYRGEPHLIAWSEADDDVRQFFLPRVREWRMEGEERAFVQRPEFDIDAYLKQGLGTQHGEKPIALRLRFSPYQARWIRERRYHASQQSEEQPDGGLIVTMEVSGRDEIRRWVQGFGPEVEVLEPEDLRAEVAAAAKKTVEIYTEPRK